MASLREISRAKRVIQAREVRREIPDLRGLKAKKATSARQAPLVQQVHKVQRARLAAGSEGRQRRHRSTGSCRARPALRDRKARQARRAKETKVDVTLKVSGAAADAKATGDALAGKAAASHTHNYAGSSSAGGAANSANKLNKNAGSATQGVYFKDGVPVTMTCTLGKSVPADAKFTDTNTWRGVQDNLTSTATDQSLSANQGKVLKGLVDGKAASSHTHDDRYYTESEMNTKLNGKANASHTHDDRYYTESEMNTKLNGKANSSHTHNYAGSGSAGGTANSVNGLTFAAQTTDPGAGSSLATNKVLIVYV